MKPFHEAEHYTYKKNLPIWEKLRDVIEGEHAVKQREEVYLPLTDSMLRDKLLGNDLGIVDQNTQQLPTTWKQRYNKYVFNAEMPDITALAIRSATSLFVAKEASVDVPEILEPLKERATLKGSTLTQFHRDVARSVLSYGRAGVYCTLDGPENTPILSLFTAFSIVNWEEDYVFGKRQLSRLVLAYEEKGVKKRLYFKLSEGLGCVVLEYQFVENAKKEDEWVPVPDTKQPVSAAPLSEGVAVITSSSASAGYRLPFIPFSIINTEDCSCPVGRPPFLGVADQCLKYYRQDASYQEALGLYMPSFVLEGLTEGNKKMAPDIVVLGGATMLPEGMTSKIMEYQGFSTDKLAAAMKGTLERAQHMAALAFEPRHEIPESGVSKQETKKTKISSIKMISLVTGEGIEKAIKILSLWLGAQAEDIRFTPNTEFMDSDMSPELLRELRETRVTGLISADTFHELMRRGGIHNRPTEEELLRIKDQKSGEEDEED